MKAQPVVKTLADRLAKNRGGDSERDKGKCTTRNFLTGYPTCRQQLRPTTFWKNVGDVEVKALVMTVPHILAEDRRKQLATLYNVETDASAKTLADTLPELKSEKVSKTLTGVKVGSKD